MIYCYELSFAVLSLYHYFNIETMRIISSYYGEDNMDWEEYIAETSNSEKLRYVLCTAHDEYYLELLTIMLPQIAFNHTDLPLYYETDLNQNSKQIDKIMSKNRVKREPFDKNFLDGEALYYKEEKKSLLNLETMDIIYAF